MASDTPKSENIYWHSGAIKREDRQRSRGHKGATIWLTGLSGSGKSTVAVKLEEKLFERGTIAYILDGDNVRHGLNRDLGFAPEERKENIRRVGEVAKLFTDAGVIVATAFISPYRVDRDQARSIAGEGDFIEVHVDAPLDVCESRDPKGLYKKARAGIIPNFTGISAPYEAPEKAEITINTGDQTVDESADQIIKYLEDNGYLSKGE